MIFLGNIGSPIVDLIKSCGDEVSVTSQSLSERFLNEYNPEYIVSYGFPHIVPPEVIQCVNGKIINLHISYLPWNKGSDPDFWSLIDNTPKGVTIHYMDANLDTGDIIVQSKVNVDVSDTLAAYYDKLHLAVVDLFSENWISIREGNCDRIPQKGKGTYHRSVDKSRFLHVLKNGSNTLVADILNFED